MLKYTILILLILAATPSNSQDFKAPEWNTFSEYEKGLTVYEKDSSAHVVVLNEIGYSYVSNVKSFQIITQRYVKLKILDSKGFYTADIELPATSTDFNTKIKASCTNFVDGKPITTFLNESNIYTKSINEHWVKKTFAIPNIKVGSIIEYYYEENSFDFDSFNNGWVFQSNIPKISSSFRVKIPEYWQYHMSSVAIDNPKFKQDGTIEKCFKLAYNTFNCNYFEMELKNIPAFKEEDFSTSNRNYLKQIIFSRKVTKLTNKVTKEFTKSWQDIDKKVFDGTLLGKEYKKKGFMKRKLPDDILSEPNILKRAQKVYTFIQQHFKWNESTNNYNTRTAYGSKLADLFDINISLVKAFIAAKIPTNFALLSTRDNGIPTKLYPSIEDFNYIIAHIKINGADIFLDATDKQVPFGMLPFRCLNNDIRIFDETKGSYWYTYTPEQENLTNVYAITTLNDDEEAHTQLRIVYTDYKALNKRKEILKIGLKKYLEHDDNYENSIVLKHDVQNLEKINKPLIEVFEIESETDFITDNAIYLKPFIIKDFESNPFQLTKRNYPVDFGYKQRFQYNLVFNIPKNYKIKSIPKNRHLQLSNDGGNLQYLSNKTNNKINIKFNFSLNRIKYLPKEYNSLKEYMNQLILAQNELIILTKD